MTLYKQLNYDVVSKIKEWKDNNVLLYQKIIDCCETTNGNLSDIADILDEYIIILSDCCRTINGNLTLILEGAEQICVECVHLPVVTTTTEECEPGTTEEPDITTEEPTYTTGEPGPEECDQPTEFHDKGTFYPYMVEKFVGPDTGMVTLDFETYDIPDRFVVMFGGVAVIDTGYHGNTIFEPMLNAALALLGVAPISVNASQVGQASFIKSTAEDHAYVLVYAPLRNTAFNFILSCPGPYTATTSEEEEVTTTSEEQTPTTTEVEVVTTTSEEQVLTTTGEPCLLDIEVLYPPQPEATTTSSEEPVTTTTEESVLTTTGEEVLTTTEEEIVTTTSEELITTTTTEMFIPEGFVFEINVPAESTITLPLHATFDDISTYGSGTTAEYDFNIYWDFENDPTNSLYVDSYDNINASHYFASAGRYVVIIASGLGVTGKCHTFAIRPRRASSSKTIGSYITRIIRWGQNTDFRLLNFYACPNLEDLPHDCSSYYTDVFGLSDGTILGAASIKTFYALLYYCTDYTHPVINENLFTLCPDVLDFDATFAGSNIGYTGGDWRTGIGEIPPYLFWENTKVTSFVATFSRMNFLATGLDASLFANNKSVTSFSGTFYKSWRFGGIIPESMFYNNTLVTDFSYMFGECFYLQSSGTYALPEKLFYFNINAENFEGTFYVGTDRDLLTPGITGELHPNLFSENAKAYNFNATFRWQVKISKIPNGLFRNIATDPSVATKTIDFSSTFSVCERAVIGDPPYTDAYPFSLTSGGAYSRFSGRAVKFGSMFFEASYYPASGTRYAPRLWDSASYDMVSRIGGDCFARYLPNSGGYQSINYYTNYCAIPYEWGRKVNPECPEETTTTSEEP